jgi:PAS domain S-box-containing protein
MRIGPKLLLGFIPLAVLTAMVAEVLYINSRYIGDSAQRVREIYSHYAHILELRRHEQGCLHRRERTDLLRLRELSGNLAAFSPSGSGEKGGDELDRGLEASRELWARYGARLDQLLAAEESAADGRTASELEALGAQGERLGERLIQIAWIPIRVGTQKARTYSAVFAVQAVLIGAVLAFYLSWLLVKPIQQLVQGTKKVSEGDFSQRVNLRSRDEIGELAQSFNRMVASLEQSRTRLNQSGEELRGTKERLENIVQSSVDAIVATDPKGRITFANRSMREMISGEAGSGKDLLGVRMADLYAGGYPEAKKIMRIIRDRGRLVNHETAIVREGRSIPILTSASLLQDETGQTVGTLGVIKDLTEKKKLEEELEKARAELARKDKLAAIGRLASGVAHELNDPLTSILTFSNLLKEETAEESGRDSLEIIIKEALRARAIVADLLSFSREFKPARQWIDLNDALKTSLNLLEKQGILKDAEVQVRLAAELPLVRGDFGQLQQVFTNLIRNAAQALPPAGPAPDTSSPGERKILLETEYFDGGEAAVEPPPRLAGPFIRIRIGDTGKGILPEDRNRIFEPFFTTKPTGRGTGLGLSIVSGILKNYGAPHFLESAPGRGTDFFIDFPLSAGEKAEP